MGYRIEKCGEDYHEIVKKLHDKAFSVRWPGPDNQYWIAYDEETGAIVGFCSAEWNDLWKTAELTRAVVVKCARGRGLQRRMVRVRVAWARKRGACATITYVSLRNYPSMLNLVKEGFRFWKKVPRGWKDFHWMYRPLQNGRRVAALKNAFKRMC